MNLLMSKENTPNYKKKTLRHLSTIRDFLSGHTLRSKLMAYTSYFSSSHSLTVRNLGKTLNLRLKLSRIQLIWWVNFLS